MARHHESDKAAQQKKVVAPKWADNQYVKFLVNKASSGYTHTTINILHKTQQHNSNKHSPQPLHALANKPSPMCRNTTYGNRTRMSPNYTRGKVSEKLHFE